MAAQCGEIRSRRLDDPPRAIFEQLPQLGEVMALTRSAWCVHERHGQYATPGQEGPVGLVLGSDIDLRAFYDC